MEADSAFFVKNTYKYNYLYLPIKVGYGFGNKIKFTPRLGIQPGFLVNAKVVHPKTSNGDDREFDLTENVSKFDFAWNFEMELSTKLGTYLELFSIVMVNLVTQIFQMRIITMELI